MHSTCCRPRLVDDGEHGREQHDGSGASPHRSSFAEFGPATPGEDPRAESFLSESELQAITTMAQQQMPGAVPGKR